ncbi:MAG: SIMPL domain-containing protein [Acidobacteriaceae bacterium]
MDTPAALLLAAIVAIGLIGAGWVLGSEIKQTRLADRYVTVKGLVERNVKSDLAIWNIGFQSSANDFKTMLGQGDTQRQTVLSFLAQQGIDKQQIEIGAPRVIDKQAQEYGGPSTGNQNRYILSQSIIVTSPDVDRVAKAGQQAAQLLQQGVILTSNSGVSGSSVAFKFNGLNAIKPDMITEATRNGRAAAQRFAADSGAHVGAIRQANQGTFSISPADAGSSANEAGDAAYPADSSIMKKVRVVTTVDYFLEQ